MTQQDSTPEGPDAKSGLCGIISGIYRCDRERGHAGNHRGYNEEHDEPVFWKEREENDPYR